MYLQCLPRSVVPLITYHNMARAEKFRSIIYQSSFEDGDYKRDLKVTASLITIIFQSTFKDGGYKKDLKAAVP